MADSDISNLPAASSLAGTEVLPVVQGGTTKKTTVASILSDQDAVTGTGTAGQVAIWDVSGLTGDATWPAANAAGVLTNDGVGVLSWESASGLISGSIASNQIAVGSGTDEISGSSDLTVSGDTLTLGAASFDLVTGGLDISTATVTTLVSVPDIVVEKASGHGIKVDLATPTFGWNDITAAIHTRVGAGTAPTFTAYQGGIFQFNFGTASGDTEVFTEYHMPHDFLAGQDACHIHTHWSTITGTAAGNVNWLFELTYAKGYSQAVFEGTAGSATTVTTSVVQAHIATFEHMIAEVQCASNGGLIHPAAVNVSISSGAAILTAASALFTSADIGRSVRVIGAGVAGGNLDTTVSAFTSTTQVTLSNNASTTVTTQDSYRYRVLDTSIMQIDGLVLCRMWRNSARTADTLSVAPFVHFVDMHVQTTSVMGTKDKNFPFYS